MLDTVESTTQTMPVAGSHVAAADGARRRGLAVTLAALFVATVVAVDPAGLVPSGPTRWTIALVVMGAAVCLLLLGPVRVDRVTGAVWLALLTWLFAAALVGADARYAWIGTPDRRLGWIAWCTFPLMFVCGQALASERDRRVVMRGAAMASVLLGVWCVIERAGWSLIDESFAGHRVGGPFGQPAYVGAAAVLLVPMAIGVACDRAGGRGWRIVGAFGAAVGFAALLLSQTRGAWIGVVVALVLLGARHPTVVRRRWREGALVLVALVVLFAVTPLGGRVRDAFDGNGTTQGRFDDWSVGARVVEHHPVLGVGPEGYRVVFPQVVSASYVQEYGTQVFPDRAHNGVIDVAVNGGVVAGLLYAALLLMALVVAWRSMRGRDPLTLALACGVVAYVVQQQFLFPLSEIDPVFWVAVGMLVTASASHRPVAATVNGRAQRVVAGVVAAGVVFGVVFGAFMGAREIVADRLLENAANARGSAGLADADHATRLRPDSIRTWYVAARIAARGPAITDVDAAVARVERGLQESPRDPALRELNADLLVARAIRSGEPADRSRAQNVVDAYLADAPNDPELWRGRAALAHLAGDTATERSAQARAHSLQPTIQAPGGSQSPTDKS